MFMRFARFGNKTARRTAAAGRILLQAHALRQ